MIFYIWYIQKIIKKNYKKYFSKKIELRWSSFFADWTIIICACFKELFDLKWTNLCNKYISTTVHVTIIYLNNT